MHLGRKSRVSDLIDLGFHRISWDFMGIYGDFGDFMWDVNGFHGILWNLMDSMGF